LLQGEFGFTKKPDIREKWIERKEKEKTPLISRLLLGH
jgi:hypothetical protein